MKTEIATIIPGTNISAGSLHWLDLLLLIWSGKSQWVDILPDRAGSTHGLHRQGWPEAVAGSTCNLPGATEELPMGLKGCHALLA